MFPIIVNALRETLLMVISASLLAIIVGVPFGVLVASIAATDNKAVKAVFYLCSSTMQLAKFVPYLLIMLLFIPLTNWLILHNISYTTATVIPLAATGSLLLARKVYTIMYDVAARWLATGKAMGASKQQTLRLIVLPESMPEIISAITHTCTLILGFSVIAGTLGAGGLGQLAVEKSIHEPDLLLVLISIATLVVIQQLIEYTGTIVVQQTKPR